MTEHQSPDLAAAPRKRRRRVGRRLRLAAALVLVAGAAAMATMTVAQPDLMDKVAGDIKISAEHQFNKARTSISSGSGEYIPQVVLGPPGGDMEMDRCTGEFIEIVERGSADAPPLYSAHNVCKGDVILGWNIGQRVTVAGSDVLYQVVEERQGMHGADFGVLTGMSGELVLQTCFYGEERMRFLALSPAKEAAV